MKFTSCLSSDGILSGLKLMSKSSGRISHFSILYCGEPEGLFSEETCKRTADDLE